MIDFILLLLVRFEGFVELMSINWIMAGSSMSSYLIFRFGEVDRAVGCLQLQNKTLLDSIAQSSNFIQLDTTLGFSLTTHSRAFYIMGMCDKGMEFMVSYELPVTATRPCRSMPLLIYSREAADGVLLPDASLADLLGCARPQDYSLSLSLCFALSFAPSVSPLPSLSVYIYIYADNCFYKLNVDASIATTKTTLLGSSFSAVGTNFLQYFENFKSFGPSTSPSAIMSSETLLLSVKAFWLLSCPSGTVMTECVAVRERVAMCHAHFLQCTICTMSVEEACALQLHHTH